ncbi:MAG: hypothetical protein ACFFC3_02280 [Candidatus Odinarchaeota archaeon]
MGLLIKSTETAEVATTPINKDSPITTIAKLLPSEAIAFFTVIKSYFDKLTIPSEVNLALWIGFITGIIYVFLSRILALT